MCDRSRQDGFQVARVVKCNGYAMTVKKRCAGLSSLSLLSVVASLAIAQYASAHGHKIIPDAVTSRYFVARGGADNDKPKGNSTLADATPNEESIDGDASDSLNKYVKDSVKEEDDEETSIESIDVTNDADSAVGRVVDDVADGANSTVNDETDAVDDEEIVVEKTRAKKKRASSAARKTKKKGRSRRSQETTTAPNNDATAVTDASSSKETSPTSPPPPPPPNALFRFLLRKGVAGHTVVMLLVTLWEFVDRYLPRFVSAARWTLTRSRLYDPDATPPSRGAIGERDGASSGRRAVDARYGAFVDARRGTRSARGAQRRRSDLAALSKLRSLATKGSTTGVGDAKYGYCSTSFLERRGLGRFASAAKRRRSSSRDDADSEGTSPSFRSEHDDAESSASAVTMTMTAAPSSDVVDEEEEESDAEWVVRALVDVRDDDDDDDDDDDSKRSRAVSDLDDDDVGGDARSLLRKSDLSLLLRSGDRFRPTKSKSGRGSSKDVPSTVVRSLLRKTISGHNTRILGAYPNDAVDVEDAGDANGVVALAKRYGYGDWSNKGSSSSSSSSRRTPKEESKKKKKNPFFQFDVSFSTDLSSGTSSARLSTKRRGRTSPSSFNRRKREERSSDLTDDENVLNVSSSSSSSFPSTTKRVRKQRIRRVKRDANKSTGVGVVKRTVDDVFPPSKKNKADSSSSSSSSSPFGRSLKDRLGERGTGAAFVRKQRSSASDDPSVASTTTTSRPSRTTTPSLPLQRVRELRKQQQDKDQS